VAENSAAKLQALLQESGVLPRWPERIGGTAAHIHATIHAKRWVPKRYSSYPEQKSPMPRFRAPQVKKKPPTLLLTTWTANAQKYQDDQSRHSHALL